LKSDHRLSRLVSSRDSSCLELIIKIFMGFYYCQRPAVIADAN
jgi:hypothetical protein